MYRASAQERNRFSVWTWAPTDKKIRQTRGWKWDIPVVCPFTGKLSLAQNCSMLQPSFNKGPYQGLNMLLQTENGHQRSARTACTLSTILFSHLPVAESRWSRLEQWWQRFLLWFPSNFLKHKRAMDDEDQKETWDFSSRASETRTCSLLHFHEDKGSSLTGGIHFTMSLHPGITIGCTYNLVGHVLPVKLIVW